jgi:hypothetical protein
VTANHWFFQTRSYDLFERFIFRRRFWEFDGLRTHDGWRLLVVYSSLKWFI